MPSKPLHNHKGNCWDRAFSCSKCGNGEFCDVCHKHDEPRGECSECPVCSECKREYDEQAWKDKENGDAD